jgi:hypothetical protein
VQHQDNNLSLLAKERLLKSSKRLQALLILAQLDNEVAEEGSFGLGSTLTCSVMSLIAFFVPCEIWEAAGENHCQGAVKLQVEDFTWVQYVVRVKSFLCLPHDIKKRIVRLTPEVSLLV